MVKLRLELILYEENCQGIHAAAFYADFDGI